MRSVLIFDCLLRLEREAEKIKRLVPQWGANDDPSAELGVYLGLIRQQVWLGLALMYLEDCQEMCPALRGKLQKNKNQLLLDVITTAIDFLDSPGAAPDALTVNGLAKLQDEIYKFVRASRNALDKCVDRNGHRMSCPSWTLAMPMLPSR